MAGIVMKVKFLAPNSAGKAGFTGYVDYMDKIEAHRWNNDELQNPYREYIEYMDNDKKTTGLFTATSNALSETQKIQLKEAYSEAEKKGSLLWQPLFSFDTQFLMDNNLYNPGQKEINEEKLKEYTRAAVTKLLKTEKFSDVTWSAAIHYNTEHVHIHISFVENNPSWEVGYGRCKMSSNNEVYQRGKFKQQSIDRAKGTLASLILNEKDINIKINDIVRNQIIAKAKLSDFSFANSNLSIAFNNLIKKLPAEELTLWKYNMNAMTEFRSEIDNLTTMFINEYCGQEYKELCDILTEQSSKQNQVYGGKSNFKENAIKDLYARMGNAILAEGRNIIKRQREMKNSNMYVIALAKDSTYTDIATKIALFRIRRLLDKDIESMKNMAFYEKFIQEDYESDF